MTKGGGNEEKKRMQNGSFHLGKLAVSCANAHGGIPNPVAAFQAKSPSYWYFFWGDQKSAEIGSYRQTVLTCRAAEDVLAPGMVGVLPTHSEDDSARKGELEKSRQREEMLKQVCVMHYFRSALSVPLSYN